MSATPLRCVSLGPRDSTQLVLLCVCKINAGERLCQFVVKLPSCGNNLIIYGGFSHPGSGSSLNACSQCEFLVCTTDVQQVIFTSLSKLLQFPT